MSTNPKTKPAARPRRAFPAKVKCEAVLAVWAERRKPSEICRELGIPWQQLQSWQKTAMEAMVGSLQPGSETAAPSPALGSRVRKLLEKTERRVRPESRLEKRLEKLQNPGTQAPDPKT